MYMFSVSPRPDPVLDSADDRYPAGAGSVQPYPGGQRAQPGRAGTPPQTDTGKLS